MRPNPDTGQEHPEERKCLDCNHVFIGYWDTLCPNCGSTFTFLPLDEPAPDHEDIVFDRDEMGDWPDRE